MAVHYVNGGSGLGLFGSILGGLASIIPGMQPFAPYIAGASALASGDPVGAISSAVGGVEQQRQNNSMFKTLWDSASRGLPNYRSDPVTGDPNLWQWHRGWKGGM